MTNLFYFLFFFCSKFAGSLSCLLPFVLVVWVVYVDVRSIFVLLRPISFVFRKNEIGNARNTISQFRTFRSLTLSFTRTHSLSHFLTSFHSFLCFSKQFIILLSFALLRRRSMKFTMSVTVVCCTHQNEKWQNSRIVSDCVLYIYSRVCGMCVYVCRNSRKAFTTLLICTRCLAFYSVYFLVQAIKSYSHHIAYGTRVSETEKWT